tara:strand:- start:1998 stop:2171 length:174 start_codon:yes stop_codon:yes gene_type:complete
MSISGPLNSLLSVSMSETLTARIAGMPSSACQVSKSECQSKPALSNPILSLILLWWM